MNKALRDFAEGALAAAVAGAAVAVLAAGADATAKTVAFLALTGAIGSVIAYARRYLQTTFPTTPPNP